MKHEASTVSVVLCALNEEANIERVLRSLASQPVEEVILVDGGSSDRTVELARHVYRDVRVLERPGEGLLRQRLWGIHEARGDLLLLLDADDELEEGSVAAAIEHLEDRRLDGSQFGFGIDRRSFWSRRWSEMLIVSSPEGRRLTMIGRPALVRASVFTDLLPDSAPFRVFAEDSFIRSSLLDRGVIPLFEAGPGRTVRRQPVRLSEIAQKSWNYGREDASQIRRFGRFRETYFHLLWRYPVVRGSRALLRYGPATAAICVMVGLARAVSCCVHLVAARWSSGWAQARARPTGEGSPHGR